MLERWLWSKMNGTGKVLYVIVQVAVLALLLYGTFELHWGRYSWIGAIVAVIGWGLVCIKLFPAEKPAAPPGA